MIILVYLAYTVGACGLCAGTVYIGYRFPRFGETLDRVFHPVRNMWRKRP